MQPESNAVMIESSYLSNSLWSPDPPDLLDFESISYRSPFEYEEPRVDYNDIECEDFDLSIDTYNDLDCLDFSSDFQLSELVNEVLGEDGDFSLTSLEFSADEKEYELKVEDDESKPDNSDEKFKAAVQCLMDTKFWSKRSSSEQSMTLDAITFLFANHLSIKNQMEVITILNPKIHFRPDDEEFSMRPSDITDFKLWKIIDYMKKNVEKFKDIVSHTTKKSVSSRESSKKSNSKLTRRKSNLNYSRTKRKQKARSKRKDIAQGEPNDCFKYITQTEKEMKSGFFVYEKKLKLCTSSTEDDEDINVLE